MNYCVALIGLNFHIPVVLRVNVFSSHILLVLHHILVGISLLSFVMHLSPEIVKKPMKLSLVTSISIFPRPLSCSSAFALQKTKLFTKIERLEFLDLTRFNCSEKTLL
jgi:hypothetical protein